MRDRPGLRSEIWVIERNISLLTLETCGFVEMKKAETVKKTVKQTSSVESEPCVIKWNSVCVVTITSNTVGPVNGHLVVSII